MNAQIKGRISGKRPLLCPKAGKASKTILSYRNIEHDDPSICAPIVVGHTQYHLVVDFRQDKASDVALDDGSVGSDIRPNGVRKLPGCSVSLKDC